MKRLHVIGGKNHGKTTLVTDLIAEFVRLGLTVGTIKHTHHHHELDVPGKDSYRHRIAGAAAVGILSPQLSAIFLPTQNAKGEDSHDRYAEFAPLFTHCQLVLVEGDSQARAPKVEVWRAEMGTEPIAASDPYLLALVTDDLPPVSVERMRRSDVPALASWLLERLDLQNQSFSSS